MARYTPVWNELKLTGSVSVAIHKSFHSNIVRQLSVCKNRDISYASRLFTAGKKAILSHHIEGNKVSFTLRLYYLNGLPVIDLSKL